MRPIEIAPPPKDANGNPKTVNDYTEFKSDLFEAYGKYCVYCNIPVNQSIDAHIDHIFPQSKEDTLKTTWENLLPACSSCNITKKDRSLDDCYQPHLHNTHIIFEYEIIRTKLGKYACIPKVSTQLTSSEEIDRAQKTIDVFNFAQTTTTAKKERQARDERWKERYEAFEKATRWREEWNSAEPQGKFLQYLSDIVKATGFFSIWFNAFSDVPEALKVIIDTFPGTCPVSFDKTNNYTPCRRNPPDL